MILSLNLEFLSIREAIQQEQDKRCYAHWVCPVFFPRFAASVCHKHTVLTESNTWKLTTSQKGYNVNINVSIDDKRKILEMLGDP